METDIHEVKYLLKHISFSFALPTYISSQEVLLLAAQMFVWSANICSKASWQLDGFLTVPNFLDINCAKRLLRQKACISQFRLECGMYPHLSKLLSENHSFRFNWQHWINKNCYFIICMTGYTARAWLHYYTYIVTTRNSWLLTRIMLETS